MTIELNDPKPSTTATSCQVSRGVSFFGQHGDDRVVFDIFFSHPPKCKGTVVEIGGCTGKSLSNSWFFEYALNWRAVLVEALPSNFALMVENRPGATNVLGAVCPGKSVMFRTGKGNPTGGIADAMSKKHMEGYTDEKSVLVEVPCLLLSDVLKNNGIDHVDLFFLDVEGAEGIVLDTFDWSIPIDVIIVELDGTDAPKDKSVRTTLQSRGYIAPMSWQQECKKRLKVSDCFRNELFVLETFWNERKRMLAAS